MGARTVSKLAAQRSGVTRTGFVTALASEADTLRPIFGGRSTNAAGREPLIAVAGIGPSAAAAAASALIRAGATRLVSWGYAAGLAPQAECGTIILADRVLCADGTVLATDPLWRKTLHACLAHEHEICCAPLLSSLVMLADEECKSAHFRRSGALAADMESAAVARVAQDWGVPCLAARVVLDEAAYDLPRFVIDAIDSRGRLNWRRLCLDLARSPTTLQRLPALAHRYRTARNALIALAAGGRLCLCEDAAFEVAA
jgi:adenosylhomocysteine nucleosidase